MESPTLPRMAANPDTARAAPTSTTPYVPKWDADPVVLCSRRARIIPFPTVLLLREPTAADLQAINAPPELGRVRDESQMTVLAGVNFLGAFTTAWDPLMFRAASAQAAPRSAPNTDHCILVAPYCRNGDLSKRPGFFDRDTGRVRTEAVHAAWLRVLAWLRTREAAQVERDGQANVPLFVAEQGYDAPEFVQCRLSEVLTQRSESGQHAFQHAQGAVLHSKDGAHLGALHDYAVRTPTGWTLATACRQRAMAAPNLMRRSG
jgi:hypothetical protein